MSPTPDDLGPPRVTIFGRDAEELLDLLLPEDRERAGRWLNVFVDRGTPLCDLELDDDDLTTIQRLAVAAGIQP